MMKIYIAGPMSGIPQFNYPAFMAAAKALREEGHEVRNPAEMDDPAVQREAMASKDGAFGSGGHLADETWGDFLARDVKIVADDVDAVFLLDGWETSRGARLEAFVALSVQKPIFMEGPLGSSAEVRPEYIAEHIMTNVVDQGDVTRYGG